MTGLILCPKTTYKTVLIYLKLIIHTHNTKGEPHDDGPPFVYKKLTIIVKKVYYAS